MWGKSKFDIEEEEKKVRKNLSRLIHTLQHFPSKRSGLDTTSLWNLVEDLESFNLDRKTNSMRFTQTTERKTYSKKCVNVQISGAKEKSPFNKINLEFKHSKSPEKFDDHSSSNKCEFKNKPNTTNSSFYSPNKGKANSSNNVGMKKNKLAANSIEDKKKNFEKSNTNKYNYFTRGNETIRLQSKNKPFQQKYPLRNVNFTDKRWKTNQNSRDLNSCQKCSPKYKIENKGNNMTLNKRNMNQIRNAKSKAHQSSPKSNKVLQQVILENNRPQIDQRSVVKKLTNYWNSLLNNEFEQFSTTTEGSRHVHSLDHLTEGSFNKNETSSENSSSTLKSRHLSESNINIMKRVEDLDSKKCSHMAQNSKKNSSTTTENKESGSVPLNSVVKVTISNYFKVPENKRLPNIKGDTYFKQINKSSTLTSGDVIEELQKIMGILKLFPTSDILSDETLFPEPLTKKMLYVLAATSMLKSQAPTFTNKLEVSSDQMIHEIIQNNHDVKRCWRNSTQTDINKLSGITPDHNLSVINDKLDSPTEMYYKEEIETVNTQENIEELSQVEENAHLVKCCEVDESANTTNEVAIGNCETTVDPGNALAIPQMNLNEVQNAVKLFMTWREMIFSKIPFEYHNIAFSTDEPPPFHSFTFICEQDVFFEEEFSDEDDDIQVNLEEECETINSIYRSTGAKIEQYIDKVIKFLENYCPHSPEVFARMIYQALVSILIWWVLVKELF